MRGLAKSVIESSSGSASSGSKLFAPTEADARFYQDAATFYVTVIICFGLVQQLYYNCVQN